ncbi:MAG: CARDB domain-containing protein, partial [Elusimicrobiota bacterium]|nr:CARDB domain-containing protein [Elusimicrobiota bacterium]
MVKFIFRKLFILCLLVLSVFLSPSIVISDTTNESKGKKGDNQDVTPPEPPTNLTAIVNPDNTITLSWINSSSTDVFRYNIYWDSATSIIDYSKHIGVVKHPHNTWTSKNLSYATYKFGVRAQDKSFNEEKNTNVTVNITIQQISTENNTTNQENNTVVTTSTTLPSPPEAPIIISPEDGFTYENTFLSIKVVAEPNTTIKIYDNDIYLSSGQADVTGEWTFNPSVEFDNGEHVFKAIAIDNNGQSSEFSNIVAIIIKKNYIDLKISAEDVKLSNEKPSLNQLVTVFVTAYNLGTENVYGIEMQLYDNETIIAEETISNIEAQSKVDIAINLLVQFEGLHRLKVVLDPQNKIVESDETNNQVSKSIAVGSNLTLGTLIITNANFSSGVNSIEIYPGSMVTISG